MLEIQAANHRYATKGVSTQYSYLQSTMKVNIVFIRKVSQVGLFLKHLSKEIFCRTRKREDEKNPFFFPVFRRFRIYF